ncbi:MAG: hypothetical protein ACI8R1_002526, partial [Psychrobacter glaciei]
GFFGGGGSIVLGHNIPYGVLKFIGLKRPNGF